MPKEIIVTPKAGQEVVINPEGSLTIKSAKIASSRLQARVIINGTYVEPPPVEPPPVEPPPVEPPPVEPPPVTPPPTGSYPTPRTLTAVPTNSDPKPAPTTVITDSVTGTKIRRISPDGNQNQYTKHQAWSKDGKLIYLQRGNIYDVASNTFLGGIASGGEYPIWSNIEPQSLYGVLNGYGPQFGKWTPGTGWKTYHDFGAQGYNWIAVGNYEGTFSRDDKVHILAKKTDGSQWMFVYDIPNDRLSVAIPRSHPDGSSITQSGKFVVLNYPSGGTDSSHGTWLLRDDMSVVRQLVGGQRWGGNVGAPLGHQDAGWMQGGAECLVYVEPGGSYTMAQELVTGREVIVAGGIFGVGHVSCANYDRPGWAYLSSNSYYPGAYGVNQSVAVKIGPNDNADPPQGEVYACLHAENPATSQNYDYAPHVSASRDGSKVIWGSVWSSTSTGPMSAYIAGVNV